MAVRPTDPEALHLFQLIGAPLLAVIQAEAQAAQVSADFIKRVGFETAAAPPQQAQPTAPPGGGFADEAALQNGGELGAMRVAEFRIDRFGADGTPAPLLVRVPVLSMFPIPLMQVKHADFDFDIHVVTRVPVEDPRDGREDNALNRPASSDYLSDNRVELKGFLAGGRRGPGSVDASIKVKVRMEQSDLPVGLTSLMRIMTESVSAAPLALVEQARAREEGDGRGG